MSEELQSLLEKINAEGVRKAENERGAILAKARAEAAEIVAEAERRAAETTARAESESAALRSRAENAIRQAARDLVLELKHELESRLNAAVGGAAKAALTPELMTEIIRALAERFAADPEGEITVLAAVRETAALDAALKGALASSLKAKPVVLADAGISGGVEVKTQGDELYFDFSLEALTEVLAAYVGGRVAEIFAAPTAAK